MILSPARELASQIAEQVAAFGAPIRVHVAVVMGGADMMKQALELERRPHVVVGTPGRLADHFRSATGAALVRRLRFLVIDEADRLLDDGFADDLADILPLLPKRRQTLYSATMNAALGRLQARSRPDLGPISARSREQTARARVHTPRRPCPAHIPARPQALALRDPHVADLTSAATLPPTLRQETDLPYMATFLIWQLTLRQETDMPCTVHPDLPYMATFLIWQLTDRHVPVHPDTL